MISTALGDIVLLGRFLWPGCAVVALIGVASGLLRCRARGMRRALAADLAVTGGLLVAGAVLHLADMSGVLAIDGRLAFVLDAVWLHLGAYLVACALTLSLLRLLRFGPPSIPPAVAG